MMRNRPIIKLFFLSFVVPACMLLVLEATCSYGTLAYLIARGRSGDATDLSESLIVLRPVSKLLRKKSKFAEPFSAYAPVIHSEVLCVQSQGAETDWHLPDGVLGWKIAPNRIRYVKRVQEADGTSRLFWRRSDRNGHVVGVQSSNSSETTKPYRVFIFGGSTVEGEGVALPEQALAPQLQQELEVQLKRNVEVTNFGVAGYMSAQEYLSLLTTGAHLHPDLVVVYDGWNDLLYYNHRLAAGPEAAQLNSMHLDMHQFLSQALYLPYQSFFWSTLLSVKASFERSTFRFGILFLPKMFLNQIAKTKENATEQRAARQPFFAKSVEYHQGNWLLISTLAKLNHFQVFFALQPLMGLDQKKLTQNENHHLERIRKNGELELRTAYYEQFKKRVATLPEIVKDQCFGDLSKSLEDSELPVYVDSGHLNERGNQMVAKELARKIAACKRVARK